MTGILLSLLGGKVPVVPDPYFEYTTLLLPGNGTNGAQNNTFLDASTNNFTITRNGNTTQGTFSPFSQTGWGNYFDGTGDYLTAPDNAAFDMGSGNFTVEFWFYATAAKNCSFFTKRPSGTYAPIMVQFTSSSTLILYSSTSGSSWAVNATTAATTLNAWHHCAMVRNGTSMVLYLDGVSAASGTISGSVMTNSSAFVVAADDTTGANAYQGYISNFRLVKGTAVYTSNFTPPTAPLTAISGTSLLTCQSNRFVDNSTNNFAITVNGNASVQAFSPFNPTASWSAATYGGSGYFDGNGDYLTVPVNTAINFGTGDFTVEAWVYPTATPGDGSGPLGGVSGNILFGYQAAGSSWGFGRNFVAWDILFNQAPILNTWQHIAVSRSGTLLRCFFNGKLVNSATNTNSYILTGGGYVGWNGSTGYFTGYMTNIRTVANALYTADFTPPTAPLTAISGTSLLLNFTNAGIYDATSKNDLETVGNAQISTTQSKWGGSSMAFDGTGDWLLIPDQPIQRIGTGNFTVEGWVYRNSSGTYGLIGKGTGTTGWLVSLNSSNQVVFTYGSSTITSTGTVSATTWTHIAVVREGTSTNQTKIYINGTNDGTGTVSTDFNQTNSMYVGADRTGGSAANAYMQDVRVTNYARYTANFTAPTAAFPTL